MNYIVNKVTNNVFAFITNKKFKSNVYLIVGSKEYILIDTGWAGTYKEIFSLMNSIDLDISLIKRILITHGDGDHVGNVKYIASRLESRVYASEETAKLLSIPKSPKHYKFPLNIFVNLGFKIQIKNYIVDYIIKEEELTFDSIKIKVVDSPGHCDGHLGFYLIKEKVLFSGDALNNIDKLSVSSKELNLDNSTALTSARKLLKNKPFFICPGHGNVFKHKKNPDKISELIELIDKGL